MSIPVSTLTGSNTINQMMYNVNTIKDLAANSAGFVANTVFQSALANTNSYIATVSATERAALANTNAYIASVASSSITGPGSSTDNAVVRFDGTSGSTAQNSGVTIADDNSMTISGSSSGDMLSITQTGAGEALRVVGLARIENTANPAIYSRMFTDSAGSLLLQADQGNAVGSSSIQMFVDNTIRALIASSGNFGIANTSPGQKLTVGGTIESTSGGFKFPDGSTQTSAASAGITTGKAIAMAIVFG